MMKSQEQAMLTDSTAVKFPSSMATRRASLEKLWIISIENGLFWFYTTPFVRKFLGILKATCWNKLMTASPYIQLVFEKELNDLWAYEVKTIQIEELCLVCHIEYRIFFLTGICHSIQIWNLSFNSNKIQFCKNSAEMFFNIIRPSSH